MPYRTDYCAHCIGQIIHDDLRSVSSAYVVQQHVRRNEWEKWKCEIFVWWKTLTNLHESGRLARADFCLHEYRTFTKSVILWPERYHQDQRMQCAWLKIEEKCEMISARAHIPEEKSLRKKRRQKIWIGKKWKKNFKVKRYSVILDTFRRIRKLICFKCKFYWFLHRHINDSTGKPELKEPTK